MMMRAATVIALPVNFVSSYIIKKKEKLFVCQLMFYKIITCNTYVLIRFKISENYVYLAS